MLVDDFDVKLSDEHSGKAWVPLEEAKALVKYHEMSVMLEKVEEFLKSGSTV